MSGPLPGPLIIGTFEKRAPGPYFCSRARRPRIVDVSGHWELNLNLKKKDDARDGPESMVDFFVHFARLVANVSG